MASSGKLRFVVGGGTFAMDSEQVDSSEFRTLSGKKSREKAHQLR